jgi:hypothetical protein
MLLAAVGLTLATGLAQSDAAPAAPASVTVGNDGNEPLVRVSPDGRTIYVTALQFVYVSRDAGATFEQFQDLVLGGPATSYADSSLDVADDGTVHVAINYPFTGTVAACVSTNEARSFACNPGVVPGVNDRQWVVADGPSRTYLTANVGLYETVLFTSPDGLAFAPGKAVEAELAPSTGSPVVLPGGHLVQPFIDDGSTGYGPDDGGVELSGPLSIYDWQPQEQALHPVVRRSPLLAGTGLPSLAATPDGTAYLVSEGISRRLRDDSGTARVAGKDVRVARTRDRGRSWRVLPPLPGTSNGTAAMSGIAAGRDGHVGVVYYRTARGSSAGTATGTWDVLWAETRNANAARPHWRTTVVERGVHRGPICSHSNCVNGGGFAGDFISAHIDSRGGAHLVYARGVPGGNSEIRYMAVPKQARQ